MHTFAQHLAGCLRDGPTTITRWTGGLLIPRHGASIFFPAPAEAFARAIACIEAHTGAALSRAGRPYAQDGCTISLTVSARRIAMVIACQPRHARLALIAAFGALGALPSAPL